MNGRIHSKGDDIINNCENEEPHTIVGGINDLRDNNKEVSKLRLVTIFQEILRNILYYVLITRLTCENFH